MKLRNFVIAVTIVSVFILFFRQKKLIENTPDKWQFIDATKEAGLVYEHGKISTTNLLTKEEAIEIFTTGIATGDYDGDGWNDLFVVTDNPHESNFIFRNKRNGAFEKRYVRGLNFINKGRAGPLFADFTGDGKLDLIVGGIHDNYPLFFENKGGDRFEELVQDGFLDKNSMSFALGDYDRDEDLDLFIAYWGNEVYKPFPTEYFYQNNGKGIFTGVTKRVGIGEFDFTDMNNQNITTVYTPNFADINNDGRPDLLVAADFGQSKVYLNNQNRTFSDITDEKVVTDENGMGAALGDYDNDGDLDWFVTSIYDPDDEIKGDTGETGNRLYQNQGGGRFVDVTDIAGIRNGGWGWGTCFADFNNDGNLDIFQTNGYIFRDQKQSFNRDRSKLFISRGSGIFMERSKELGINDTGQGRAVSCFDYDNDGDVDIFVMNKDRGLRLFRNEGGNINNSFSVKLRYKNPNIEAVGARIFVTSSGKIQMRELQAGNNFESQNPANAHFGLGKEKTVDRVKVLWPDGNISYLKNVSINQQLILDYPPK